MNTFKNFIKQYFFMLALAGIAVGFSAFKVAQPEQQNLVWYERINANTYALMDGGTPSAEPSNGCTPIETTICAKGFLPLEAPAPEDVNDDRDDAVNRYHQ